MLAFVGWRLFVLRDLHKVILEGLFLIEEVEPNLEVKTPHFNAGKMFVFNLGLAVHINYVCSWRKSDAAARHVRRQWSVILNIVKIRPIRKKLEPFVLILIFL